METNRRDFFRKAGQLTCFSILVAGSGMLFSEKRVTLWGCGDNQFCEKCGKIQNCTLDQAKEQRKINNNKTGYSNQKL